MKIFTPSKLFFAAIFLLAAALIFFTPAAAQQGVDPQKINDLAKDLWCPLCNNVRLDTCELKACEQMKEVIGQKLAAGESKDSIRSYFVAQYGPQVLGEPPQEGINWLAWITPFLVILISGAWLLSAIRRSTQRSTSQMLPATKESPQPSVLSAEELNRLQEELRKID